MGVILYEICCMQYPFPATNIEDLERKVLNDKMQKITSGVSTYLADLISKMLKKDPRNRPSIEEIIYSDIFQQKA